MTARTQGKAKPAWQPYTSASNSSVSKSEIPGASIASDSSQGFSNLGINRHYKPDSTSDVLCSVLKAKLADGFSSLPHGALRAWLNKSRYSNVLPLSQQKKLATELLKQAADNLGLAIDLLAFLEKHEKKGSKLVIYVRGLVEALELQEQRQRLAQARHQRPRRQNADHPQDISEKTPQPSAEPDSQPPSKGIVTAVATPSTPGQAHHDRARQEIPSDRKRDEKPVEATTRDWSWSTIILTVLLSIFAFVAVVFWLLS